MTKNYRRFGEVFKDDDSIEVVAEHLRKRKEYLDIREWVEMSDLFVDAEGNIYYVEVWNHTPQIEEGHGFHDVGTDEPEEYLLFLSSENYFELMKQAEIDEDEAKDDLKPWQWIVLLSFILIAVWAIMWIVIPQ